MGLLGSCGGVTSVTRGCEGFELAAWTGEDGSGSVRGCSL